jgi:hypothetical protein
VVTVAAGYITFITDQEWQRLYGKEPTEIEDGIHVYRRHATGMIYARMSDLHKYINLRKLGSITVCDEAKA